MASVALNEHGPHLVADIEAQRATTTEAVAVGLARIEASLRRRIAGEASAAASAAS